MDGYILQLSMDLDNWTEKPTARYLFNQSLESIWNNSGKSQHYYQTGKRALVRYLSQKSEFRVPNLNDTDFDPGTNKIITFNNLVNYLKSNKDVKASRRLTAITFGIQKWSSDDEGDQTFFGESLLEELWHSDDYSTEGVRKIIQTFQNDKYFKDCDEVKNMSSNLFNNGGVKTVSAFCHYLKDCRV